MKRLTLLVFIIFINLCIFAQTPQGFQYQSVIRNSSGNLITNQSVGFRISIIATSPSGNVEYSENHTVSTNQFGVAILNVGSGIPVTGTFNAINWGVSAHYIKIEADPTGGSGYLDMGTTQLLSVPYALYSENSADTLWLKNGTNIYNSNNGNVGVGLSNPIGRMVVQGSTTAPDTLPLFEVKDKTGHTVFVVYPDSVHIYVKDGGAKSNKGGFAVSGRNNSKAFTNNFLTSTHNKLRWRR